MNRSDSYQECFGTEPTIFSTLTPEELVWVETQLVKNSYKKGDFLYHEGNRINGIYFIKSGIVKAFKTGPDGKEQIVAFAKKGNITGYRSTLSNEPACTTAQILEEAVICYIPGEVIFELIRKNGNFSIKLLQLVCKELNQANSFMQDIAQKTVRQRLAEVLLSLEENFGVTQEGNLNIILTREELANIIGTATESVIRLLSELKRKGIINIDKKHVALKDKNQLKNIALLLD